MLGRGRDKKLYGTKLIQVTTEKVRIIKDQIKAAQDRKKSMQIPEGDPSNLTQETKYF
jgi:hypothetical protein